MSIPLRTQRAGRWPRGSFAFVGTPTSPTRAALARQVAAALAAQGLEQSEAADTALVVNLVEPGITATGESVIEIFDRIQPRLLLPVPME